MGRVAGVFDNPPGFPCTPPGIDVLEGGKLTSNNEAGSSHDPLQSFAVASGAVSKPGGDAAGQDALHSAFISSRVDCCNGFLPKTTIRQRQLIQNTAAWTLTRTRTSEHITPVLRSLH